MLVQTVTVPGSLGNSPGGSATNVTFAADDIEVALDIEVIVSVAQGANVVVYFAPWTEQGWADALSQIANDTAHDPSVLSISWGWPELDAALAWEWTPQTVSFVSIQFTMLAAFGTTVLVCSGDTGTDCGVNDGRAHVLYPASDPGVIACGGTRLALDPFFEQTWKDPAIPPEATGGGVSDLISPPSFQAGANVPASVNGNGRLGRGVPDVAGNASPLSGYYLWLYGQSTQTLTLTSGSHQGSPLGPMGGTSAVAPLYAALIALINTTLGTRLGYLNPSLYNIAIQSQSSSNPAFRDVNDNISNSVEYETNPVKVSPGYNSGPRWDCCTGWGSINGTNLLFALSNEINGPAQVTDFVAEWSGGPSK